jgi:predicted lipoprotein with Yx(FWY)xxD motif
VKISVNRPHHLPGRRLFPISLALGAAAAAAACSSSSSSTSATAPTSSAPASASAASVTISAKSVPGVGNVLVNGQGLTLYMLTSEKGGKKLTCTVSNGCTKVWPEIVVPTGTKATAGSGVQSALLGTVTGAAGGPLVTYNGWPLYTFEGDSGPGMAKGQGLTNFGGTWYVLNAAGTPVTSSPGASSSPSVGANGY